MHKIIKRQRVRMLGTDVAPEAAVESPLRETHERGVSLIRVGERVEAIELTCPCGETTILEIEYEDPSTEETTS